MLRSCLVATVVLLLAASLRAQQVPPVHDTVVVTAIGESQPADQVDAASTVVTADELRLSGAPGIAAALRRVPGATLLASGLDNNVTTLFVRGTNSSHTLVLWDGVRLNSPFFGGYDWSLPMTAGVGQVEVVRGPYSALYGGDAIGGVVQFVSERARANGARLFAEAGSLGWRRAELEATATSGPWDVVISAASRDGSGPLANDDFFSRAAALNAGYSFGDGGRAGVIVRRTTSHTDVPFSGASVTPHRFTSAAETLTALPLRWRFASGGEIEASFARVERRLSYRDPDDAGGFRASDTTADSNEARLVWRRHFRLHAVAAGFEWRRDAVTDGSSFGPNLSDECLTTRAAFVQDRWMLGSRWAVLAGVRADRADPWGNHVSPRVVVSRRGDGWRAWASFGRAFRAPGLGELYYPFSGNRDLRPETSDSGEVGVIVPGPGDNSALQLVAFRTRIRDLVDFDFATYRFANIARAAQDGIEASFMRALGADGRVQAGVTWLDARDGRGDQLLRRPRWTASASVSGPIIMSARGELMIVYVGARPDLDPVTFGRVQQAGFVTASLAAAVPLASALSLRLRLENLADRAYQEVRGYPAPGRRVIVGLESVLR